MRRRELSPAGFRKLAIASATSLYLIVVTGAAVRLTASGLGCDSWPGCQSGSFFPENDVHGAVEFGNRAVAIVPISLSLATAVGARWVSGLPRWAVLVAAGVVTGTVGQAPLGLLTITSGLHPLLVMTHFLLALVVLAGAVVLALAPWREPRRATPPLVRRLGLALAGAGLALVVTGAFATAAGPHPGDSAEIRRFGSLETTVWIHVRATALFGIAFLVLFGYLLSRRADYPRLFRVAAGLMAILVAQMVVGEIQYRTELPWGLVLVHVSLAAAIWAATVAFVTLLWRPPERVGEGAT